MMMILSAAVRLGPTLDPLTLIDLGLPGFRLPFLMQLLYLVLAYVHAARQTSLGQV